MFYLSATFYWGFGTPPGIAFLLLFYILLLFYGIAESSISLCFNGVESIFDINLTFYSCPPYTIFPPLKFGAGGYEAYLFPNFNAFSAFALMMLCVYGPPDIWGPCSEVELFEWSKLELLF